MLALGGADEQGSGNATVGEVVGDGASDGSLVDSLLPPQEKTMSLDESVMVVTGILRVVYSGRRSTSWPPPESGRRGGRVIEALVPLSRWVPCVAAPAQVTRIPRVVGSALLQRRRSSTERRISTYGSPTSHPSALAAFVRIQRFDPNFTHERLMGRVDKFSGKVLRGHRDQPRLRLGRRLIYFGEISAGDHHAMGHEGQFNRGCVVLQLQLNQRGIR